MRRCFHLGVAFSGLLSLGFADGWDPGADLPPVVDEMLLLDPVDPLTGKAAEIVPGAPWARPGGAGQSQSPARAR